MLCLQLFVSHSLIDFRSPPLLLLLPMLAPSQLSELPPPCSYTGARASLWDSPFHTAHFHSFLFQLLPMSHRCPCMAPMALPELDQSGTGITRCFLQRSSPGTHNLSPR